MSFVKRLQAEAVRRVQRQSVLSLVRLACWVALVGLAVLCASILDPAPLTVIFAMSVGQVIGVLAFLLYLLSIVGDVVRGSEHPPEAPGPAKTFRAESEGGKSEST